jgi:hypothetical protein
LFSIYYEIIHSIQPVDRSGDINEITGDPAGGLYGGTGWSPQIHQSRFRLSAIGLLTPGRFRVFFHPLETQGF